MLSHCYLKPRNRSGGVPKGAEGEGEGETRVYPKKMKDKLK